jgi:hypothetical protein
MTRKQFWVGIACLYGIGLAVAVSSSRQIPPDGWGYSRLRWSKGIGPIGLTLVWLALKRWNLDAAKFGLVVFAGLYLVMVLIRWWWQDLL